MVSVILVSVVFLLTQRLAWCLESRERNFTGHYTLNGISLNILKQNPGRNVALAPFLFRFSLCKLATVATGETKKELQSFLELEKPNDATKCFVDIFNYLHKVIETDMTLFNKIYVNYTDNVNRTFFGDSSLYGVSVSKLGFQYNWASVNFVNREMDSKTYKRLVNVLDIDDINQKSSMLLVNGVHMKPTWEQSFNIRKTVRKTFHLLNHTVIKTPMMNTVMACLYINDETELFSAISLHLAVPGLTATFIVTDTNKNITDFFSILSQKPDAIGSIKKRMKHETIDVFLPRFRIKMALDWTEYLKMFGLNLTLTDTQSDLNGILIKQNPYNMYVSKAKQKVFVDIDEMGNHRGFIEPGVQADMMGADRPDRGMVNPSRNMLPQFIADRPFFFSINLVTHNGTSLDLVNGAYYGPEE